MKRKINIGLLLLSLILILLGYRSMRETLLISRGNSLSLKEKYIEADKVFKEAAVRYSSKTAQRNRGVNLYNGEEYEKLIESGRGEKFLRGNAHAYLGEQNPKKMKEHYKSALTEYREAMKGSGDINIKKNYEIVSRRLEDMKNREEKQQENRENQDQKQNKDQQEQDKRNSDQKQQQKEQQQGDSGKDKQENSQENKKQNKGPEDQNQEQGQQDRGENTSGSSNKPDSDPEKGQLQRGEAPEETTQRREALTILERLEGSEEQAFKNNERLERIGGEEAHEAW
ncbi:hypothetical protein PM10SUCC1_09270 [Propionigenium maris DSM 9537]|uniref:Ca-activated chloride channel family protein n=1 Tax=Propionigenium maris DSM 9537 TaxID=1123000 RepID=A0A9W6LMF7_9FUSO|nr:hypothetical protein [Propionigenium maris]GLI55413.1 hypothetical protein PM10SUCC1_09270 [Propionigenium maris DSM 9537]